MAAAAEPGERARRNAPSPEETPAKQASKQGRARGAPGCAFARVPLARLSSYATGLQGEKRGLEEEEEEEEALLPSSAGSGSLRVSLFGPLRVGAGGREDAPGRSPGRLTCGAIQRSEVA